MIFDLLTTIFGTIYIVSLVVFVTTGYYFIYGRQSAEAIQAKRKKRGLKFIALGVGLVFLDLLLPAWVVGLIALAGGIVAFNRVRKIKYPLGTGGSATALPGNSTYKW